MAGYPVALSLEEFVDRVRHDEGWRDFAVDSRAVNPGSIFFALPGEHSDGHSYLGHAIAAGARALVLYNSYFQSHEQTLLEAAGIGEHSDESPVSTAMIPSDAPLGTEPVVFIPIADSLGALQQAGAAVLDLSRAKRLAVTGSNGKTGTKDLLAAVMRQAGTVHSAEGNFNSVIGLPVILARTPADVDYAVLEMAMSEVGEMDTLTALVRPHAALLTNVGTAHIGNIGSTAGIAREKFRIFSLMEGDDLAVIPAGDTLVDAELAERPLNCRVRRYALTAKFGFEHLDEGAGGTRFSYGGAEYRLPVIGRHHIHNACGVITMARELGLSPAQIQRGFDKFRLPAGRGNVTRGDITLINDSYNANPDSMAAAFSAAAGLHDRRGRLIFILADMKELGDKSTAGHLRSLKDAMDSPADIIALFGADSAAAAKHAAGRPAPEKSAGAGTAGEESAGPAEADHEAESHDKGGRIEVFTEFEKLREWALNTVRPGDTVLIKGSRSMELERIIPFLPGAVEAGSKTDLAEGGRETGEGHSV